jgi:hypothetical protein
MNTLREITAYLEALLQNRPVLAIAVGLVFALAMTQWLKFVLLRTHWLPDPKRWIVQALAMPLGASATFVVFPAKDAELAVRIIVALAVGAAAPYVYRLVTAILYRLWPQLEARLSADPYGDLE